MGSQRTPRTVENGKKCKETNGRRRHKQRGQLMEREMIWNRNRRDGPDRRQRVKWHIGEAF